MDAELAKSIEGLGEKVGIKVNGRSFELDSTPVSVLALPPP